MAVFYRLMIYDMYDLLNSFQSRILRYLPFVKSRVLDICHQLTLVSSIYFEGDHGTL